MAKKRKIESASMLDGSGIRVICARAIEILLYIQLKLKLPKLYWHFIMVFLHHILYLTTC